MVSASIGGDCRDGLKAGGSGERTGTMARKGGWRRVGSRRHLPLRGRPRQTHHRPGATGSDRVAGDTAGLEGRLDLTKSERAKLRRPASTLRDGLVPLPPGLPRQAGAGEVRQADPLRRTATGPPRGDDEAPPGRRADERVDERRCAPPDRSRLVSRRLRPLRKEHRTFGITTLRKSHVTVRGNRVTFKYRGKQRALVHTAIVDDDLAEAIRVLRNLEGGPRLFRYRSGDELYNLTARKLNEYVQESMGDEFTAKYFRTGWDAHSGDQPRRAWRSRDRDGGKAGRRGGDAPVGEKLGNTPAVARSSYVSPAVVEQYLDGRTIDDFRPRHLRVVRARNTRLEPEERARWFRYSAPGVFAARRRIEFPTGFL